jgi:hypothetical protein
MLKKIAMIGIPGTHGTLKDNLLEFCGIAVITPIQMMDRNPMISVREMTK